MIGFFLFCLFHCKESKLVSYSFCLVDDVKEEVEDENHAHHWIAHCDAGGLVSFNRSVVVGDRIYFAPYYENDDAVTTHGYIEDLEHLIP